MAIRNSLLGGTDWTTEHPTYQDLNDTNNTIIRQSILVGENAVRVLQANNVYVNGPNIIVDETTDSTGTNNTINTGTTTAFYDGTNDEYRMSFEKDSSPSRSNITNDLNNGASLTTNSYDTTNNLFDLRIDAVANAFTTFQSDSYVNDFDLGDITNKGMYFDVIISETESAVNNLTCSGSLNLEYDASSLTIANSPGTYSVYIFDDGTDITVYKDNIVLATISHTTDLQLRTSVGMVRGATGNDTAVAVNSRIRVDSNYFIGTYTDSLIIVDANTTSLDSNELGFGVSVPDSSIPTNTSITATISDGTNSLSAATIDSVSKGVVIGNPGTLTSGTLEITFTLATTDTSITPTFPSYGITILR